MRIYAFKALAGYAHEIGKSRARAYEHRFIAVREQLVHGKRSAYHDVCFYVNAQSFQPFHFARDYCLGQTEFGYAVYEHAARRVESFEHRHLISLARKVARARQSARTRSDDSHFMTVGRGTYRAVANVGVVRVCGKAFQSAYADRLELYAESAFGLALRFLRAYPAAYGGKRGERGDDVVRALEIPFLYLTYERGYVYSHGTTRHAGLVLAVKATLSLFHCYFGGVTRRNFVEIMRPYRRILRGHGMFMRNNGHFTSPPL